jgi:ribonucleoside-diphosphate reductase alpha chain
MPEVFPTLPIFSLSSDTELFQNEKGIIIKIDRSRDSNLTDFGKATLKDRYLGQNESFQDLFARVASSYADDNLHAQRIYNYISNLWFMPATPVLSNGGTKRGLPISCFLNEASDSLDGRLSFACVMYYINWNYLLAVCLIIYGYHHLDLLLQHTN